MQLHNYWQKCNFIGVCIVLLYSTREHPEFLLQCEHQMETFSLLNIDWSIKHKLTKTTFWIRRWIPYIHFRTVYGSYDISTIEDIATVTGVCAWHVSTGVYTLLNSIRDVSQRFFETHFSYTKAVNKGYN